MWDRRDRKVVRVVRVWVDVEVREGVGDGSRGKSVYRIYIDWRSWGCGCVYYRRNWGGWGSCKWDLDSRRYIYGVGYSKVFFFVGFKYVGEAESLVIYIVWIGFFVCVSFAVFFYVGAVGEVFVIDFIDKGFFF